MMDLKEKLLSLNLLKDDEWLDKYIELIEVNKETKYKKFKTQCHHIIPKCYYKHRYLEIDDSKDNLVNLSHKDHVLAHYYLWMCSNCNDFKHQNGLAVYFLTNISPYRLDLTNISNINSVFEQSIKYRTNKITGLTRSSEVKEKISATHKGKVYINKDGVSKSIDKEDLDKYLNEGWIKGNPKAASLLNKVGVVKDGVETWVEHTNLNTYLDNGYIIGRKAHPRKGMHNSAEMRHKQSLAHLGRLKGTVHINNGIVSKMVFESDLDNYLNQGFKLGRLKFTKNKRNKLYESI